MGSQEYMRRYGAQGGGQPDLEHAPEEFEDWVLKVPFQTKSVTVLCCPEDRRCPRPGCTEVTRCCSQCEIPLCRECKDLGNFLWV